MPASNNTILTLNANSYQGTFRHVANGLTAEGNFSTDGNKTIVNISGTVKEGENQILAYNAYRNGTTLRYNFNDIRDFSKIAEASVEVQATEAAIVQELVGVD